MNEIEKVKPQATQFSKWSYIRVRSYYSKNIEFLARFLRFQEDKKP